MLEVSPGHTPRRLRWWLSIFSRKSLRSGMSALNTLWHNFFLEGRVIDVFKCWITLDLVYFGLPLWIFFRSFVIRELVKISSGSFEGDWVEVWFCAFHGILVNFFILLFEVILSCCKHTLAHLLVLNPPSSWPTITNSRWCVFLWFINMNTVQHMFVFINTGPKLFYLDFNLFNMDWALKTYPTWLDLNCLPTLPVQI